MPTPDSLVVQAPAKINLYLKVTGRRDDGYHLLDTLMQKIGLFDEIELRPCAEGVQLRCPVGGAPESEENLVYRAAERFLRATHGRRQGTWHGIRLTLIKRIPVAAGLGGGSSDAAATLCGLNSLSGCCCSREELATMGLQLGADVPFFLSKAPAAVATGIGEVLQPVAPMRGHSVLLVNPGFPVSTRWVYQSFALTENEIASSLKNSQEGAGVPGTPKQSLHAGQWPLIACNDLEKVTVARYPVIAQLKAEMMGAGAVAALMSGSGPTVFGLFNNRQRAEACFLHFKGRFAHTYLVDPVEE